MAGIQIDLSKVKNANNMIPGVRSGIEGIRRSIGILRWRVDPEIMNRHNVRERFNHVVSELENIEKSVAEIYNVTENIISQYFESEQKISSYASKFK